jgi:hypothetical protein
VLAKIMLALMSYFSPADRRTPFVTDVCVVMGVLNTTANRLRQSCKSPCAYDVCFVYRDRLCGLVVRVLGYRSRGPGSIPGTTRKKGNGSGTGSTQPREHN